MVQCCDVFCGIVWCCGACGLLEKRNKLGVWGKKVSDLPISIVCNSEESCSSNTTLAFSSPASVSHASPRSCAATLTALWLLSSDDADTTMYAQQWSAMITQKLLMKDKITPHGEVWMVSRYVVYAHANELHVPCV